ncbi:hypothetical protein FDUTEX481_02390 [Tolypothrix sp. PCC 7601]|nr:hypothetical protein FDUTEX481_02390 [Tolypothrix sp. PCC 7601]
MARENKSQIVNLKSPSCIRLWQSVNLKSVLKSLLNGGNPPQLLSSLREAAPTTRYANAKSKIQNCLTHK